MDNRLREFLEQQGVLRKVMQYIWQYNNDLTPRDVYTVAGAFTWDKTPEGYDYWD